MTNRCRCVTDRDFFQIDYFENVFEMKYTEHRRILASTSTIIVRNHT